jgi:c-di-GMP phosphodiesterase
MQATKFSHSFLLTSSSDVEALPENLFALKHITVTIHISTVIQNTVLIHKLKQTLKEVYPTIEPYIFTDNKVKSEHKKDVLLTIYTDSAGQEKEHYFNELVFELSSKNYHIEQELQKKQDFINHSSSLDSATSLPNLLTLRNVLKQRDTGVLILFSIDNFKMLNDFYGFDIGDFIINSVSKSISKQIRGVIIYKTSSNEFAVILDETMAFYELKRYLQKLSSIFSELVYLYEKDEQKTELFITCTLASSASQKFERLFAKTNMALHYAQKNQISYWIYEDKMRLDNEFSHNVNMASKIRKAMINSGIVPYFQAIIDNKTNKVVKFEALARLIDEDGVIHVPDTFIHISKMIKMYELITINIIEKSFNIFENNDYDLSINISVDDIMNAQINSFILEKLKNSTLSSRITFELVESHNIQNYEVVSHFFTEVKRYGAKIAIDNFGSGFLNFSHMTHIDPDFIKIDGGLIQNIDSDKNAQVVVKTIISFCKELGIETVAEHVHTSTILTHVQSMGIDFSQGFHIDKPRPELV